jgi:outer membrane protein TolC
MKRITSILVFLLVFQYIYAQEDTLLQHYRSVAIEYQQQIKMAQSSLEGAESLRKAAGSDYLPKFDFGGRFSYYGVPLQLAPPADAQPGTPGEELHSLYSVDLTLSQPVFAGGYLRNTKYAAASRVDAMQDYLSLSRQEVMLKADMSYWKSVAKNEMKDLVIKYRDDIGKFLDVIQDRVDEEIIGMNELYQVKVRYNDAVYEVIKYEKEYAISVMEFNRLMGFPIDSLPVIADSLSVVLWQKQDTGLTTKALEQRPEISLMENKILVNQYKEKITASKYNPKFGLLIGGKWGAPSPGLKIDPAFNYYFNAKLAIPIFYWGKRREEVFALTKITEIAKLDLEQTRDMVSLEAQSSYYDLERSQAQLDFAFSALDNASKNVAVMLDRYNEGLSPVLEVLDAQMFWEKTYFNYIQAKYQLNTAHSNFMHAMGELTVIQSNN